MRTEIHRVARFCFKTSTRTQRRILIIIKHRRQRLSLQARPLSWEIPKHLFPRPETFFPRPERVFDGDTFRDLILKQGEVIRDFPWEYIILLTIVAFVIAEIFIKPSDSDGGEDEEPSDTLTTDRATSSLPSEEMRDRRAVPKTDEERMLHALKKIHFQEEQNRNLAILGSVALLALWMAGFLNTPHPFYP